jgi:crossover junction endodeoxyribonuclease RuvC
MQESNERIILGIDPGTTLMGYGVIKGSGKTPEFVALDVVDLRRAGDHYLKLRKIYECNGGPDGKISAGRSGL